MTNLEVAKKYFDLSNKSDFPSIEKLFADTITYSSENTGIYFGKADIIKMQKEFHGQFQNLKWHVNSAKEIKPGVVLFDYTFQAKKLDQQEIESDGLEYVIVSNEKIQHIEIRNK